MPLISVVIPTYNAERYIEACLKSVAIQRNSDFEVIVVDGKSNDRTIQAIKRFKNLIGQLVSEPDSGIYDAMNKGLKMAQGELICFLGADDRLTEDALEQVTKAYAAQKAHIYAGSAFYCSKEWSAIRPVDHFGKGALLNGIPFCHNAMYATRESYDLVGQYDTTYRLAADANWVHRAIRLGLSIHPIKSPLVCYNLEGTSAVDGDTTMSESYRTIRENFPYLELEDTKYLLSLAKGWAGTERMPEIRLQYENYPELLEAMDEAAMHVENCGQRIIDAARSAADAMRHRHSEASLLSKVKTRIKKIRKVLSRGLA